MEDGGDEDEDGDDEHTFISEPEQKINVNFSIFFIPTLNWTEQRTNYNNTVQWNDVSQIGKEGGWEGKYVHM